MPRLDERALRREGFSDGPRIQLGDGQEWTFPRPAIRTYPIRREGGGFEMGARLTYGRAFADRWEDIYDAEPGWDQVAIVLELAAELLSRNYDLDDRALGALLARDFQEEGNREMWTEIESVLQGTYAPKLSAGGSDSPSSSTESTATSS